MIERDHIHSLSVLLLNPSGANDVAHGVTAATEEDRAAMLKLASAHHVVIRAFTPLAEAAEAAGELTTAQWARKAVANEQADIDNSLRYLNDICNALERNGCPTTVIKSLDHTPDLGNDLDLYTTCNEVPVIKTLVEQFQADVEDRSWGDRLAGKWNFVVPGLNKTIEMHTKRLGQTGEHTDLARRFVSRRTTKTVNGYNFYIPAAEERVVAATLQRMYRHFYFRLCDIVNTAQIVENGELDFAELRRATRPAGIWPGVATFLNIVSDYVQKYRGTPVPLPKEVKSAAVFGGNKLTVKNRFLRLPIMPQSAQLYGLQMVTTAAKRDFPATFRLSLLPPLASAAKIAVRLVGTEKAVW
jgi:Uncharacterised nucleotidyltransferase